MMESQLKKNITNQNGSNLLDDDNDDIFVSTYDKPSNESSALSSGLENKMNNVDLHDSSASQDEAASLKLNDDQFSTIPISLIQPALNQPALEPEVFTPPPPAPTPAFGSSSLPEDIHSAPVTPILSPSSSQSQPSFHSQTSFDEFSSKPAALPESNSKIQVSVGQAYKKGEGISSFMVYPVKTKTSLQFFRKSSICVDRRFSDFLGLYDKLQEKHSQMGRIVPPPPSKSMVGTAKAKFAKQAEEQQNSSDEFLEKRRAALERFLQRNAEHPAIVADPDFREFLETESELPRSTSTSALSGAGVKRMFSFVSDTVNKMTFKMDETDPKLSNSIEEIQWFESKQTWLENLDIQLKKLYSSVESLVHHRKEMTSASGQLAKSTAILGNCEEHNSLSCALSQLAATHEKIEKVYEKQASNDIQHMAELLKDYIALMGAIREVFHIRVKCFQNLSSFDLQLNKKREAKARFELALRQDKVQPLEVEIRDLEEKVEKAKQEFDQISKNIREEFDRFEVNRIKDFKNNFIIYMENLLETQESLVEIWEQFLPESKSIQV